MNEALKIAHTHSSNHRQEIMKSNMCGCFHCCEVFQSTDIHSWIDEQNTALCPICKIDSVIGTASGYLATDVEFLKSMHEYWFK